MKSLGELDTGHNSCLVITVTGHDAGHICPARTTLAHLKNNNNKVGLYLCSIICIFNSCNAFLTVCFFVCFSEIAQMDVLNSGVCRCVRVGVVLLTPCARQVFGHRQFKGHACRCEAMPLIMAATRIFSLISIIYVVAFFYRGSSDQFSVNSVNHCCT